MVRRYRMLLKMGSDWQCVNTILASGHSDALRQAIALIEPAHYDKQLRIEEEVSLPTISPTLASQAQSKTPN